MSRDLCTLVARLVIFFRDAQLYKDILVCRETDAQRLLDLLQDVRASFPGGISN
jgi:hypothetical protein